MPDGKLGIELLEGVGAVVVEHILADGSLEAAGRRWTGCWTA